MNIGNETVICTEGDEEGDRMEGGGASFHNCYVLISPLERIRKKSKKEFQKRKKKKNKLVQGRM